MKTKSQKNFYHALPSYFGGKRKLVPWIFGTLATVIPPEKWPEHRFLDAFLGGGSVSLFAKAQGFQQILANDWSDRSQIIGKALLENQRIQLSREDTLRLTQPLAEGLQPGFVESTFCPSVFSTRHARLLDGALYQINQVQNSTRRSLLLLLLWHLTLGYVCFPTSLGSSNRPFAECLDGIRHWDSLNPKRFIDGSLDSLLKPGWSELDAKRKVINRGVFGGAPFTMFQQDAVEFIRQVQGDILYLDPPYAGTLSYEKSNRVLDSLLIGKPPEAAPRSSPFSTGLAALNPLFETARHIPFWILSYGNKACSLKELVQLVQQHVPNRHVQGYSTHYRHLSHVSKTQSSQELLVIAYPKNIGGVK